MANENKKEIQVGTVVETPKHGKGTVVGFGKSIDKQHQEYTVVHVETATGVRHFALSELK